MLLLERKKKRKYDGREKGRQKQRKRVRRRRIMFHSYLYIRVRLSFLLLATTFLGHKVEKANLPRMYKRVYFPTISSFLLLSLIFTFNNNNTVHHNSNAIKFKNTQYQATKRQSNNMAILDFSKDSGKSIAIHFHTKELGPEGQPLYYHTPENPAGKTLRHFMAIANCLCRSTMANRIPSSLRVCQ